MKLRPPATVEARQAGSYRWVLLLGLPLCASALIWYGFTIGILLPDIRDDLGLSTAQEGYLSATFFLGQFLFMIPLSHFLSRYPPVRTMAVVFAGSTVLLVGAAAFPNFQAQLLLRLAVSALFVALNPVRTLIITTWFRSDEVTLANGVFNAGLGMVQAVAFWSSGPLLGLVGGWRAVMASFAVLSGIATVLWFAIARDARPGAGRPAAAGTADTAGTGSAVAGASPLRAMLRREIWYLSLVGVGGGISWATFLTFWPTFAEDELLLSDTSIGLVLGLGAFAIIPSSLLAARILERVGRRQPLLIVITLLQVPTFALLLWTDQVVLLSLISIAQGLMWFYFPILFAAPFQMRGFGEREIAVATGLFITINSAALAAGPAVAGMLAERMELRSVLLLAAMGPVLSTGGALLLRDEPPVAVAASEAVSP